MTLILKESEINTIKEALKYIAYTNQRARDLLDLLSENPDCTEWTISPIQGGDA